MQKGLGIAISGTALKIANQEISMDNPVGIAIALFAVFTALALYQHYQTSDNVSKAVDDVTSTRTTTKANKKKVAEPATSNSNEKEVVRSQKSAKKKTPGKKQRKKTPVSNRKKKDKDVKITFSGSFGLRIESGPHGNVFVTGFVNKQVDLRIERGMYITHLNDTKVPLINSIDNMVSIIGKEKEHGPVTVTFSKTPNFAKGI